MSESVPVFPVLFISEADREKFSSKKNPFEEATTITGTITILDSFLDNFEIVSYELKKINRTKQVTVTAKKVNGHGLLNITWPVGNIPEPFRPNVNISGLFPYGTTLTDIGQTNLSSNGDLIIRSGDTVYIVDDSTFTFTLTYI